MTRSGIPRPASIATLVEDPPEFNGNTSQDMLENDSKLAEAALDDDEKTALKNGDYEVSRRYQVLYILIHGIIDVAIICHQITRLRGR